MWCKIKGFFKGCDWYGIVIVGIIVFVLTMILILALYDMKLKHERLSNDCAALSRVEKLLQERLEGLDGKR